MISKRSARDPQDITHKKIYLKAFGEELQLNLKPNREFNKRLESMKLFTAESSNGDLKYVEEPMSTASIGRLYHDDEKMAAVVVRHGSDGKIMLVSLSHCLYM